VKWVAVGALVTAAPYLLVQTSDWVFGAKKIGIAQPSYVKWCAFSTMCICFVGFVVYLVSQVEVARQGKNSKILQHEKNKHHIVKAAQAFLNTMQQNARNTDGGEEDVEGMASEQSERAVRSAASLWRMKARAHSAAHHAANGHVTDNPPQTTENVHINVNDIQPLIQSLQDEEEPKWKIALKSSSLLVFGVGMVTFFSDPMCDALTALTNQNNAQYIPIGSFYVSFVVTPLCSNASELVSSILFAMKKEKECTSMTYSQIYGACIMNNTLCLGVFCALIFFGDLEWYYSAEVTIIVAFEVLICGAALATKVLYNNVYPLWMLFPALLCYPASIGGVYFLEEYVGWH
jgi:Ca2+/Na+ antiporter